jgi:hypothetical protein
MRRILIVVLFGVGALRLGYGQDAACRQRKVVVNVRDKGGVLVAGLQPDIFRLSVSHQPLKVISSAVDASPRRVVILLHASRGVAGTPKAWDESRRLAENLVHSAPRTRFALVLFASEIIPMTTGFDTTDEQMLAQLRGLPDTMDLLKRGRPGSALRDAIFHAADFFGTPIPGDAIYLITDGVDKGSHTDIDAVRRELISRGIRLFSLILVSESNFFYSIEADGISQMNNLSRDTGGWTVDDRLAYAGSQDAHLEHALDELYDQISRFYLLKIEEAAPRHKASKQELTVVDQTGERQKDLSLHYPHEVEACVN